MLDFLSILYIFAVQGSFIHVDIHFMASFLFHEKAFVSVWIKMYILDSGTHYFPHSLWNNTSYFDQYLRIDTYMKESLLNTPLKDKTSVG